MSCVAGGFAQDSQRGQRADRTLGKGGISERLHTYYSERYTSHSGQVSESEAAGFLLGQPGLVLWSSAQT